MNEEFNREQERTLTMELKEGGSGGEDQGRTITIRSGGLKVAREQSAV